MKIYLAHNYKAKEFLKTEILPRFAAKGHEITSRWITDDKFEGLDHDAAYADLRDIDNADVLILFADQYGSSPGKGKYVELGYAVRSGKRIIVVGKDTSCVFFHLNSLTRVETLDDTLAILERA